MIAGLENKTILMLIAHADDELIALWPILQDHSLNRKLLCASSDENNAERQWCAHRKTVLFKIVAELDIPAVCLPYPSSFYRLNTRDETLKKMMQHVLAEVDRSDADIIATHNPFGEYHHQDHLLLHQLALHTGIPLLYTDILIPANHAPYETISDTYREMYFREDSRTAHCVRDEAFYERCKGYYADAGCWTWSRGVPAECNLFMV